MKQVKSQLRKKYKLLRNEYNNIKESSQKICGKFINSDEYKGCGAVFTFLSFGSEVETADIINKALSDRKIVALPYMTGNPHDMVFIKIKSLDSLVKNKTGIYEPIFDEKNIVSSDDKTIIIVPGLVFDSRGYRIGYGGGYYDKYLSENKYMLSVGLAFDFQIEDCVPADEYDIKTDVVITDRRTIYENFK